MIPASRAESSRRPEVNISSTRTSNKLLSKRSLLSEEMKSTEVDSFGAVVVGPDNIIIAQAKLPDIRKVTVSLVSLSAIHCSKSSAMVTAPYHESNISSTLRSSGRNEPRVQLVDLGGGSS